MSKGSIQLNVCYQENQGLRKQMNTRNQINVWMLSHRHQKIKNLASCQQNLFVYVFLSFTHSKQKFAIA